MLEVDLKLHFENIRKFLTTRDIPEQSLAFGFCFSLNFVLAVGTLIVLRKLPTVATPVQPLQLTPLRKALPRLFVLIGSIAILYYSFLDLSGNKIAYLSSCFFVFYCLDLIVDHILNLLEHGIAHDIFRGDPPTLLEWAASLFFSNLSRGGEQQIYLQLIQIHVLQQVLSNLFGIFDLLDQYRFVPSAVGGILNLMHFVYHVFDAQHSFPMLFYMERLPETIVFTFAGVLSVVYLLTKWISGNRVKQPRFLVLPDLKEQFSVYVRQIALSLADDPISSGFSYEQQPIFAPAGLGLPPNQVMQEIQYRNPFYKTRELPKRAKQTQHFFGHAGFMYYIYKLWFGIFRIFWLPMSWLVVRKEESESDTEYEDEEWESESEVSENEDLRDELLDLLLDQDPQGLHLRPLAKSSEQEFTQGDDFSCVVCQTNNRSIVLSPCGCLALCDSCRESLALRNYKECPTCRQSVTGYQRIFVP
ncbi:hypothetical protein EDD86DRAFT_202260 [Gorgonomyces haynaldii]|nr:hypothetical protein EDD86DRAFT_202260 [Gorgonomyces haynaldii]